MIIPSGWALPESIRSRVSPTTYGRQRAIIEDGHLLLILHRPPGSSASVREGVLFWRTPSGEWQTTRSGSGVAALRKHVQEFAALETKWNEAYEASPDTATLFELLEEATPTARAARNMHLALQSAREGIENDLFLIEMRDLSYEVERNLEVLQEDLRHAISYRTARESEETARLSKETLVANHRLNLLAALFLPITALTSVFGMNLNSGVSATNPLFFWAVLALGILLGVGMAAWVRNRP